MASLITSVSKILENLELSPAQIPSLLDDHKEFPVRVTQSFLDRIRKRKPDDPLLLQIIPRLQEHLTADGFTEDPVGDQRSSPTAGVIHKYQGRALLICTSVCHIHCRYCFRRAYPYESGQLTKSRHLDQAMAYIAEHTDITEVILSGGDPLTIACDRLEHIIQTLDSIPHVQRIRIHSRQPIVDPDSIGDRLLNIFSHASAHVILVVHANHAQEIDQHVEQCLSELRRCVHTLLNQSVLLHNINDNADALAHLSLRLFECGVIPYYINLLDKVSGSHHFDVSEVRALALIREMREKLPGYLMPRLVRDDASRHSKTIIA